MTGSAALFYLTNSEYRSEQSVKLRRQVIQVVLNGMESYQEVTVQRNCCLTLCNFSIPEELEFQYRRVNELLLSILNPTRQDESIQRIAVHLCNALVCQVDNDHKEAVGKMGFVVVRAGGLPLPAFLPSSSLAPLAHEGVSPDQRKSFPIVNVAYDPHRVPPTRTFCHSLLALPFTH